MMRLTVFIAFVAMVVSACNSNASPDPNPPPKPKNETVVNFGGNIEFTNLPPHRGIIVSLAFFPVDGPDSNAPYEGDPPTDAVTDCPELYNNVVLDAETSDVSRDIPFSIEHAAGHFYIQIRVLLFRKHNGKVLAQSEQFFFGRRPLPLTDDLPSVTLPVEWPSIAVEDLEHYGTVKPQ